MHAPIAAAGDRLKAVVAAAGLALCACDDLPRDPEETSERVRTTGVLRAGVISGKDDATARVRRRFVDRVARETGSRPRLTHGTAEQLLPKIEKGELDIVVGELAPDSPWNTRVTILPPPKRMEADDGEPAPAAAVRNGENGWVALVHRLAPLLKEGDR